MSKQANSQAHHLNKPDCLKLSNYERHLLNGQIMILTYIAKNVHVLIYLTKLINFAPKSSISCVNSFPYESPENNYDFAIKCQDQSKSIIMIILCKNLQNFPYLMF